MSELKARTARSIADAEEILELGADCPIEQAQVYLKSEADKVIAEKDKEIARLDDLAHAHNIELLRKENLIAELKKERDWLAKDRAQAYDDLEKRAQLNIKQEESILHQKYKRCLANAETCQARYDEEDAKVNGHGASWEYKSKEMKYCERWCNHWLAIAEKFKEGV